MCDDFNISKVQVKSEYIEAYDFEIFDGLKVHGLVVKYRWIMYTILGGYLIGIYFGQKWMKNREPFCFNNTLFFWNAGLASFSILATLRGYPETFWLLSKPNGIYMAVCSQDHTNYATVFWGVLFMLSKFVELGDTAFIILRKQKLIVLHWFHHMSMVLGCWLAAEYLPSGGRFYFVNAFVHSFMYSYYAFKALKFKIPKKISMALTTLQIFQLFLGVVGTLYTGYFMYIGRPCRLNMQLVYLGVVISSMFLILFLNFFYNKYLTRSKKKIP